MKYAVCPTILILPVLATVFLVGCTSSGPRYKDLFAPVTQMNLPIEELDEFPVFLINKDTNEPAPGARMIIGTLPEALELEANEFGQILVPVDSTLLRENPSLDGDPDTKFTFGLSLTYSGRKIESVRLQSAHDREKIGDSRLAVYYEKEDEASARKLYRQLDRSAKEVKSIIDLEPKRWSVILEPTYKEKNVLYLTVPAPGYDSTWVCFKEDWESLEFLRTNIHEWTESTVVSRLSLYDDPRNRFIGDGVAELTSWRLYGLGEKYGDYLSLAQVGWEEAVDLLTAFKAVSVNSFQPRKIYRGIKKRVFFQKCGWLKARSIVKTT